MPHGVGIVGAGPGVAALHLPTLARLSDDFEVVHIADGGSGRAEDLAARVGARSSSGIAELLADPAVEVVVLASPPAEHASQILAAVAAGKRAILCEKPLATTLEDADEVIAACRLAGTALLVGTNHLYDPAWGRAKHHLLAGGHKVRAITVTLALPPNGRYHDVVTELSAPAAAPGRGGPPLDVPQVAASVVRQLITGLAVHELPMLRDLAPTIERVVFARAIAPIGYVARLPGIGDSGAAWPPSCCPTAPTRYGTSRSPPTPTCVDGVVPACLRARRQRRGARGDRDRQAYDLSDRRHRRLPRRVACACRAC